MKKFAVIIIIFCSIGAYSQIATIKPIERTIGNLHISIDPRMELLTTVQLLSNYPVINRNLPYNKDVMEYFSSFSSQEAVKMTDNVSENYGFSYDAPITMMLYLSQVPELKQQMIFSERLLERGGGAENLEQYRNALKQFAEVSNFEGFWNSRIPLYNKILDLTISEMGKIDLVKVLENYYNETQASYNIILSPSFMGGYGPRIPNNNGKYDIYACITTFFEKESIPYMSGEELQNYIWHEWGHSFVNPLTEKYMDRVSSSEKLLEPIAKKMAGKAYPHWNITVNEHIVRAIHIRLLELYSDSQKAKIMLEYELSGRFIYVVPLIEKLKDFEKQRDKNGITFSEFYPELLNLFDSLLETEYWKQVDMNFKGPLSNVTSESKRAFIYPTQDSDTESLKAIQDYVTKIFNMSQLRNGLLLADTTALKTDLSDYGISAYGTIESNLFLKHYASVFPFKIENKIIYADKEYTDPNIRLIFCVPNPHNPEIGMMVLTAISNKAYQKSMVIPMDSDYVLLLDSENILSKGFFKKEEKWEF